MKVYNLKLLETLSPHEFKTARVYLRDTLVEGKSAKFFIADSGDVVKTITTSPVGSMKLTEDGVVFRTMNSTYLLEV